MSSFTDKTKLLCSGIVIYSPSPGITATGYILMPCGQRHEDYTPYGTKQLPYRYQIYRERARLATCCYWKDPSIDEEDLDIGTPERDTSTLPTIFEYTNVNVDTSLLTEVEVTNRGDQTVTNINFPQSGVVGGWEHESTPSFFIQPITLETSLLSPATEIPTKCQLAEALLWHQGQDGAPPCNGAKTECPFYTGPKFQYINDEQTAPGQTISGEIVQELRSLLRDWSKFKDPQKKWEKSFEEPYTWAKDFADKPMAIQTNPDPTNIGEVSVYTILTQIYWKVEEEVSVHIKYPSEESGTEKEENVPTAAISKPNKKQPPKFPTIVRNLGFTSAPDIEINFPPIKKDESETTDNSTPFIYETFDVDTNKIYIAGKSSPVINLYIINKNFFSEFPDLTSSDVSDTELDNLVSKLVIKHLTAGDLKGFKYVTSNQSKFWHLIGGIDLKAGEINKIFVLGKLNGQWSFDFTLVDYTFHHVDIVQDGFIANLETPATQTLVTHIANLLIDNDTATNFSFLKIAGDVFASNIYHYHIFDRSLSRLISGKDTPTNKRYWKVVKEEKTVTGDENKGQLTWKKLDNCNRYIIEILNPIIPIAIPAGLDRSWEPIDITFNVQQEPGTSTHGTQQDTKVKMKVVAGINDLGRSLKGSPLPTRFIIVEPETSQNLRIPFNTSTMEVKLEIYKAVDPISNGGEDVFIELLDQGFNSFEFTEAGGVRLTNPSEEDELDNSPHTFSLSSSFLSVFNINKFDMSYVIEFTSNKTGHVVGRKWIYGVGEISNTWFKDVDIFYSWLAPQAFDKLLPDYFKAIARGSDGRELTTNALSDRFTDSFINNTYTVYNPKCGDHDVSYGKPGPMFSPYEDCDHPYIKKTELGLIINYRINHVDPIDEKYRGPDFQTPELYKHNVFGTIFPTCYFEYSLGTYTRSLAKWGGYARLRGPISLEYSPLKYLKYKGLNFEFPKFGNIGRDQIRIYKTMHYREYLTLENDKPKVHLGWLPSFPYISNSSLFTQNKARISLEQGIQTNNNSFIPDLNNYDSMKQLITLVTEGEIPNNIGAETEESFFFERKKFDDVYRIKKIRTLDGAGTRWPENGFYFNFRNTDVIWAHAEPTFDLIRNYNNFTADILDNSNFLSGIEIHNPQTENYPEAETDKYGRPIHLSLEEGENNQLQILDIEYDVDGNVTQYASIFINPDFKLYFDRFTGEIKTSPSPDNTDSVLYNINTISGLVSYLSFNNKNQTTTPYFEFVNSAEENQAPTTVQDTDMFVNSGNLYTSVETFYIYPKESLDGPLDIENTEWSGFFPSIKVENIFPRYMPKKELQFDDESTDFQGILPTIKFSSYPSTSYLTRSGLSNQELKETTVHFFEPEAPTNNFDFEWLPYVNNDLTYTGGLDTRQGFIGPMTITCEFTNPIELSHLHLKYRIYGLFDSTASTITVPTAVPPKFDPSLKISLESPTAQTVILVEKARQKLVKYTKTDLDRNFKFSFRDEDASPIDPFIAKKIIIEVGKRESNTGFELAPLFVKALKLNDEVKENILIIEPKYMITTGYYNPSNKREWAQDPQHLTGTVTMNDISDSLEYAGVAEFWHALNYDNDVTVTEGKLRRHWTNKFLTWDVDKTSNEVLFNDVNVDISEARQEGIVQNVLTSLQGGLYNFIPKQVHKYFISPFDVAKINKDFKSNLSFTFLSLQNNLQSIFEHVLYNASDVVSVNKGKQAPGWQDQGFFACLSPETTTAACVFFGFRTSFIAYKNDQQICRGNLANTGLLHPLLDLPGITRDDSLLGVDPISPSIQQQLDPNSLIQQSLENAQKESILSRTEEYKNRNKRYQE